MGQLDEGAGKTDVSMSWWSFLHASLPFSAISAGSISAKLGDVGDFRAGAPERTSDDSNQGRQLQRGGG